MEVTLYSLPASVCRACKYTKTLFNQKGITFQEVPLATNPQAMEVIKSLGYAQAPVIVVDMGEGASWSWSGLRPSQIDKLAELVGLRAGI
jgi:glutaredoxin-like protein NrdH